MENSAAAYAEKQLKEMETSIAKEREKIRDRLQKAVYRGIISQEEMDKALMDQGINK